MSKGSIKGVTKTSYGTLTYFDCISPTRIYECVSTVFDEAAHNKIVPIMNQDVLDLVITKLKEDKDVSAEFISFSSAHEEFFFSYTVDDLDDWPDCLAVLGTLGLVLDPSQSIEIIFPYLHGMRRTSRAIKTNFPNADAYGYEE
jgi:hypothetical protein